MKYYSYIVADDADDWNAVKIIVSEEEILEKVWDEWCNKMKEAGRVDQISRSACIDDFCVINWASEEPVYRFQEKVYQKPFAPFYDAYKGHIFVVDQVHPEDPTGDHVSLACLDDQSVKVNGFVHLSDMEKVDA